ncbi:prephenate dehydrogenase [Nonlabens xylanidelens]|uniref:Prephenate dehydrogenase n=1 Tax=Nonlabens xylanidelens TaxID=191564 RepID=A0A2S6IS06_9FLAO|nr:prephenate dehydrogenase [Nonlabens xylanidelens]PPK97052.1 prephenate dehydrogenase [Nonlabens xylanidelens]PQJ13737.1 prephenate dehydrogenase [Nonlabens xylanidelens]
MKNIFLIGTGLIGGSILKDLRNHYPESTLYGIDKNPEHALKAKSNKIIDHVAQIEDVKDAQLVIVSIPVDVALKVLPQVLDLVNEEALVIDVGSTKEAICKSVEEHKNRRQFLAAHPIAGTEFSGPDAAIHDLFKNKTMIVCEVEKTAFKLQESAIALFEKLKMRVRYMTPAAHDKHIAYVSHLSHISSFMLGKTVIQEEVNERDIFDLAGSGFESTVRLAKSSPAMWTPIFAQNKEHVLASLDGYIENLSRFRESVKNNDHNAIFKDMEQTNRIKTILKGIENGK